VNPLPALKSVGVKLNGNAFGSGMERFMESPFLLKNEPPHVLFVEVGVKMAATDPFDELHLFVDKSLVV
jgi:hypothetical protein